MVILDEPIKEVQILRNYINGEWVEPSSKVHVDIVNPALMKVIGKVPRSNEEDMSMAVRAAAEAFPGWGGRPPSPDPATCSG